MSIERPEKWFAIICNYKIIIILTAAGPAIVTTVVPVGPHPTHMICPSCHAEMDSYTQTKPGLIAYVSGTIICMLG